MTLETATLPLVASLFLGSVLFLLGYLLLALQREEPQPVRVRVTDDEQARDPRRYGGPGSGSGGC
jgi:hypothetical protein